MEATMTYLPLCNGGSTARAIPTRHARRRMADVSLSELAAAVSNRRPERLDEPLEREPYDLFVARTGGFRWVGRKVPTEVDPGQAPAKSCLITASMIAGLFDEFQISAAGVRMYFRPLDDQERGVAFAALVSAGRNDIQYPITRILADGLTEVVFAHDFWKPDARACPGTRRRRGPTASPRRRGAGPIRILWRPDLRSRLLDRNLPSSASASLSRRLDDRPGSQSRNGRLRARAD